MKKLLKTTIALAALAALVTLPVHAGSGGMSGGKMSGMDHGQMDHGNMDKGQMDHGGMDHGMTKGEMIRQTSRDGNKIMYHLIDNAAEMAKMSDMKAMKGHDMSQMKSHHLMSYFAGMDGKSFEQGKVGYLVEGPDGATQKVMAMAMAGGFGADVDLKTKGAYTIKAKGVFGDTTVTDEFTYEVK